jgi:dienelactone hydrolase
MSPRRWENVQNVQRIALSCLIAASTAAPGFAQGLVDITGTVTVANARVSMPGRGLEAFTDQAGRYTLKENSTGLAAAAAASRAEVAGAGLRLTVAGDRLPLRVTIFTLAGTRMRDALDAVVETGSYAVDPFAGGIAAGMYLVQVRMGAKTQAFRLAASGRPADGPALRRDASGSGSAVLRKEARAPEVISVVAVGWQRAERTLEGVTGIQDFKLGALAWTNVPYRPAGAPACSRCILDVRKPASGSRWPVIIHFHGGGMTGGDRNEPFGSQYANFGQKYLDNGLMVVTPGYTLAGGTTTVWPQYIKDAATASAWVRKNIESFGGDPKSVFISGFSAGAYLTHMLSLDTTYLKVAGSDATEFAGFISMSGQTRTHDNIRNDLKVSDIMKEKPYAMPMGQVRKTTVPWQIFVGSLEGGTIDSNKALYDALLAKGSTNVYYDVIPGQGHTCSDIAAASSPKRDKLLAFIAKHKAK